MVLQVFDIVNLIARPFNSILDRFCDFWNVRVHTVKVELVSGTVVWAPCHNSNAFDDGGMSHLQLNRKEATRRQTGNGGFFYVDIVFA